MNAAVRNVPDEPVEPQLELQLDGLPAEDVDFLFSGLKSFSRLTLAVSGGADSLSLLVLFSEWSRRAAWQGTADVVCVDHRLRAESADEAAFVARKAAECGLAGHILSWDAAKPAGNLQQEARRARYLLIAGHMSRTGAEALLLGHHLDDQAETFLDRLTRGSGLSGLSAMAADEADGPHGLRLLRPFLSVPKARLEASLLERGLTWCTDPSNRDPKYKRSRLRRIMTLLAEEGLTADRIAQTAGNLRRARHALEKTVRDLAARLVTEHPAGPLKMRRDGYRETEEDLRLRLLSHTVGRVTGERPRIRLRKLQALDAALLAEEGCRQTLSGALFQADGDTIGIWKEPGRVPPETQPVTETAGIWDNRYRYSLPSDALLTEFAGRLLIGPLCRAPVQAKEITWPDGWPKEAFDCSPAIWTAEGDIFPVSVSAEFQIGNSDKVVALDLERMPIQGKLEANYLDDGDTEEEI